MEECVELCEGLAAFGPQSVGRIQYPRNPLLLREGGNRDFKVAYMMKIQSCNGDSKSVFVVLSFSKRGPEKVFYIAAICLR